MGTNYLLAIDQGTSSTRALIFNQQGNLISKAQCDIQQFYLEDGWVEHDAEEIWEKTLQVCRDVLIKAKLAANQIQACGITNQRETTVVWDKLSGKLYHRAIVWQDRRTQVFCKHLAEQGLSETIQAKTGLVLDPYFSASKLNWLLEHVPKLYELAKKGQIAFGTMDSFLLWRLTKGVNHATDVTNASRTMLYNIKTQRWDEELLTIFNIPSQILPEVLESSSDFGVIHSDFLGASIPITGIIGDQQAAMIGQGCLQTGMLKATYGTGGFLVLNTGQTLVRSKHRLLSTILYKINNQVCYGIEGSLFHAGSIIKWLRDNLQFIKDPNETQRLARQVNDNGGVYLVPAFTGLGAPYWKPKAQGILTGLTTHTHIAHIVRAALESIAYQTKDIIGCMEKDSSDPIHALRVDGGVTNNTWLLQFLADLINIPVYKGSVTDASALGSAYLAGLTIGTYTSLKEIQGLWQSSLDFMPHGSSTLMNKLYQSWLSAVEHVIA